MIVLHCHSIPKALNKAPAGYHSDCSSSHSLQLWLSGEFFGMKKEIAVEPLVGHMRHPYGVKDCVPEGEQVGLYSPALSTLQIR